MGGSECRFVAHPLRQDKYLTLQALDTSKEVVVVPDQDHSKEYQEFFFRKDEKSEFTLNMRFKKDSDLYICATPHGAESNSDKWAVVCSKKAPANPAEGQWKIFIVGKRKTGTLEWKQEENYKLDWNNMKGHSIKAVLLNMASKMVLSTDPFGKLCVERLKLSPNKELVTPMPAAFWNIKTVNHGLSPGETKAAIAGGIVGGAAVGIGVATMAAGIALAVKFGRDMPAARGVAARDFIAEGFKKGKAAVATVDKDAVASVGKEAVAAVSKVGETIGAAMKKAAVISVGAVKSRVAAIRDDNEGIPNPQNSEEKQLQYIAILIEQFDIDS